METQRQAGRHSEKHSDTVREMLLKLKALCQRRHAEIYTVRHGQTDNRGHKHTLRDRNRESEMLLEMKALCQRRNAEKSYTITHRQADNRRHRDRQGQTETQRERDVTLTESGSKCVLNDTRKVMQYSKRQRQTVTGDRMGRQTQRQRQSGRDVTQNERVSAKC